MAPRVYKNFAPRPNFIINTEWEADGDGWVLICDYLDENGDPKDFRLSTLPLQNSHALICLPTSNDVEDLSDDPSVVDDIIRAHIRCATQIGLQVPGSTEWVDALKNEGESSHMQTAIGTVKYVDHTRVDDGSGGICFHVQVRKGTGPIRTVVLDYDDLESYVFAPSTQLGVLAGSIEKEFSSYVHDPDGGGQTLTQTQRDNIAAYVEGLTVWM